MDERVIDYDEVDIKGGGMEIFQQFYKANRDMIFRTKEGIEFPVFTDGATVRQGVGVVIAYLLSGTGLDGFIGHSQLSKGWIDGLHVSSGDTSLIEELVTVLDFLEKKRTTIATGDEWEKQLSSGKVAARRARQPDRYGYQRAAVTLWQDLGG